MRWYRLHCIDCRASTRLSPEMVYCQQRVEVAGGVIEAWAKAQEDGYWPLYVLDSDWMPDTVTNGTSLSKARLPWHGALVKEVHASVRGPRVVSDAVV